MGPPPAISASVARAPVSLVLAQLRGEVDVGQDVAVEHEEALGEQVLGELQRAAGAERLAAPRT